MVLIAGNHDQPSRLEAVIPLVREHGILIYGTPRSKIESGQYGKFQIESLDERVFSFEKGGEQAVVACVPYASERTLNECTLPGPGRRPGKSSYLCPENAGGAFWPKRACGFQKTL